MERFKKIEKKLILANGVEATFSLLQSHRTSFDSYSLLDCPRSSLYTIYGDPNEGTEDFKGVTGDGASRIFAKMADCRACFYIDDGTDDAFYEARDNSINDLDRL
ncbi:hypothetical protein KK083_14835 [Fulvivirgaceae bacterium PWU4]|uniref:Uncharacterized protein n=1 Tax=Chryseosolibacter histidini TaxID=2782349 RepID=A0AAP2GJB4_9BACT|nr:hypothetical protein [Chryseosolibacter histidini]MBT1698166.1 hypothetical protein [Chryseosolibacter histidini]